MTCVRCGRWGEVTADGAAVICPNCPFTRPELIEVEEEEGERPVA